jgi:two-component system response regulator
VTSDIQLLLVEDNPSDAELMLTSLRVEFGHDRLFVARDGVEALDFLFCRGAFSDRSFDSPPRLVLLDVKLPKVDGLEVLRQIKSDSRTLAIPVVMLTSSRIEQDVMRAYRFGANSYVQKPMEFERFRETVHGLGRYWLTINERAPRGAFLDAARS